MSTLSASLITTPSKPLSNLTAGSPKPPVSTTPIPPSPGTFRHPRLTEIIQRQSASSLTSQKIQNAVVNLAAIFVTLIFGSTFHDVIERLLTTASIPSSAINASSLILLLRVLFVANTIVCLRPVLPYLSSNDDVVDIPLTPSQRALIGLSPSNRGSPASAAGSAGYVTPPRYRRDGGMNAAASIPNSPPGSATSRRSISANYASSPVSTSRYTLGFSPSSPSNFPQSTRSLRTSSESPFAGSSHGSPLLYKAINNDFNQSSFTTVDGRASLGTSSSLGYGLSRSHSLRERKGVQEDFEGIPGTPSPSGPKRPSGINYKWLYDKGARQSRGESTGF